MNAIISRISSRQKTITLRLRNILAVLAFPNLTLALN